jgi:hypothetical protein
MSRDVQVRICERLGVRLPRATRLVITVSGHSTKAGWAQRALQRLEEQLIPMGVALNREKTKIVDTLKEEAFGFLGFGSSRQGCNSAGESPAASVARVGCEAIPRPGAGNQPGGGVV